jgi:heme oxygenase
MTPVDYSKPLATLLKERTLEIHDSVATSDGANLLTSGKLSREEYTRYLMMLWHVYELVLLFVFYISKCLSLLTCRFPSSALEKALESHATHPALEPTYNPTLLERAPSLAADISHLLDVDESSWKYHPIHINLMAAYPSPLSDYVQRIEELSNSSDPSALLAHSYVRYLGDLSGGQTIRHTLAKAYNLDEAAGFGLSFYKFKELRSSKVASQGEMKRIKDWFREGMNVAGERNFQLKGMSRELKIDIYRVGLFENE